MITEDYVSFETAKLLKEKGFDEKCFGLYGPEFMEAFFKLDNTQASRVENSYSAPTLQMAMKWLREKELVICIIPLTFYCGREVNSWGYNIWAGDNFEVDEDNTPKFTTYEEACEAGIKYCLENLI